MILWCLKGLCILGSIALVIEIVYEGYKAITKDKNE